MGKGNGELIIPPHLQSNEEKLKNEGTMTVTEIINDLNAAVAKVGTSNDNKRVMFNAAIALRQLVDRLYQYENENTVN